MGQSQLLTADGATTFGGGTWAATLYSTSGLSGSVSANVSDNNDDTQVAATTANAWNALAMDFTTFTLAAGEYVEAINILFRTNVRQLFNGGSWDFSNQILRLQYGAYFQQVNPGSILYPTSLLGSGTATTQRVGPFPGVLYLNGDPAQGSIQITQAVLDSLSVQYYLFVPGNYAAIMSITKAYLEVYAPSYPSATVTTPVGSITDTMSPTVKFTYNQGAGGLGGMGAQRIRVFSAAQIATAGFSPDSGSPIYDSGDVFTPVPFDTKLPLLSPGTSYTTYIRVGNKPVTGNTLSQHTNGLWYTGTFRIDVLPPVRPAVSVSDQPNGSFGPRVDITVTDQQSMLSRAESLAFSDASTNKVVSPGANTTVSIDATQSPPLGTNAWKLVRSTTTGTVAAWLGPITGAAATSANNKMLPPVVAGLQYAMYAYVQSLSSRQIQFTADWYTSAGNFISTSTSSALSTTSAWGIQGATFTAPGTAAFVRWGWQYLALANTTEGTYITGIVARPYQNSETIPPVTSIPSGGGGYGFGNKLRFINANGEILGWNTSPTNCAVTLNTAAPSSGLGNIRMTASSTGTCVIRADNITSLAASPNSIVHVEYTPNSIISMGVKAKPNAASVPAFLSMEFYDGSGNFISQADTSPVVLTSGAYVQVNGTVNVPVGANWGIMKLTATLSSGNTLDVDEFWVSRAAITQWFAPPVNTSSSNQSFKDDNDTIIYVERSADAGVTWTPVRNLYNRMPQGTTYPQAITSVPDYEIVAGIAYQYRAYAVASVDNISVQSPYSAIVSITPANPSTTVRRWWFKDVENSTNNLQVDMLQDSLKVEYPEDVSIYSPLGRNRKVFISDTIKGVEMDFYIDFLVEAEFDAFMAMRGSQRTLVLQRWWNSDSWYVKFDSNVVVTEENTNPVRRLVKVTVVEVDVPPVV